MYVKRQADRQHSDEATDSRNGRVDVLTVEQASTKQD